MSLNFSRLWWRVAAVCIALSLAFSAMAAPPKHRKKASKHFASAQEARIASAKKAQLRNKLRGLSKHMHQVRAKIHQAKVKENIITENIGTVEARITKTKANIHRVNNRLDALDQRHDKVVAHLEATEARLAKRKRLLAQRVADNYRRGQTSYTQVLLQSRTVHEMISRGYYVRRIVESDTELIQGVKQDIAQIKTDKAELEAQEREQKALAEEFEAQKQQFAADLERKHELLSGVQANREQAEDELDELENESNQMTDRIRQLSEMLRRRQEAQREAERARRRQMAKKNSGHTNRQDPEPPDEPAQVWHGGFIRPAGGPVTSGFGYRYHPILHRRKLHTGTDFGAHYGSPIRAAAGGTVILAQYNHGYGNCVIIDHGGGTTTLYGHASALLVSAGDSVKQGQVIARVGSTGLSTGPHLHFEMRQNGVPVQPPF